MICRDGGGREKGKGVINLHVVNFRLGDRTIILSLAMAVC